MVEIQVTIPRACYAKKHNLRHIVRKERHAYNTLLIDVAYLSE